MKPSEFPEGTIFEALMLIRPGRSYMCKRVEDEMVLLEMFDEEQVRWCNGNGMTYNLTTFDYEGDYEIVCHGIEQDEGQ